jgi:hypothetical protein
LTFYLETRSLPKPSGDTLGVGSNKKIKEFVSNGLTILQNKGYIVGTIEASSNAVAACCDALKIKENGAGSGNLVPPSSSQREGNISNPRVLSDTGLAILMKKTLNIT